MNAIVTIVTPENLYCVERTLENHCKKFKGSLHTYLKGRLKESLILQVQAKNNLILANEEVKEIEQRIEMTYQSFEIEFDYGSFEEDLNSILS